MELVSKMTALIFFLAVSGATANALNSNDILIKFKPGGLQTSNLLGTFSQEGKKAEVIAEDLLRVVSSENGPLIAELSQYSEVEYVQPNYRIHLIEDYKTKDEALLQKIEALTKNLSSFFHFFAAPGKDPSLPKNDLVEKVGADTLLQNQWGMANSQATKAWGIYAGSRDITVAVLDTGIDYTHEDLIGNLWRNTKEISDNGIDDDQNGYVDDIIGWDFAQNDNKPFDITVTPEELLKGGGNPGHGTHCAGNVGATGNNGKGISGVAQKVRIMGLRFLTEKGEGTTADAIKAIRYGVQNGAKILSNSWGSEGEDEADGEENKALRDVITEAQEHGVLFIAAAGNGHNGVGYNNDTDAKPGYPASYDHENIISVAAIDKKNALGSFSNWGKISVDIGAPGVDVYSTVPGGKYTNYVIDFFGFKATWDGTSMATPHVAGAAALLWAEHPELTWRDVKARILSSADPVASLNNKSVTGGKLNVLKLIQN